MKLVIVESPAKARKIRTLLGEGFKIAASMGHVRDLPPKGGLAVAFEDGKVIPTYEALSRKARWCIYSDRSLPRFGSHLPSWPAGAGRPLPKRLMARG